MLERRAFPSALLAIREGDARNTLCDFLRAYGVKNFEVFASSEGAFGSLRSDSRKWDLLILDCSLPDAFEHIVGVRCCLNSPIHVLVLVSEPARTEIVESIQMIADGDIPIPLDRKIFGCRLDAVCRSIGRSHPPSPFSVPPN